MNVKSLGPALLARIKKTSVFSIEPKHAIAWAAAFFFCLIVILANMSSNRSLGGSIEDFEAGKVAERDVVAERSISYEDTDATRLRREAQERLVPAVFTYSREASEEILKVWNRFVLLAGTDSPEQSREAFRLLIQSEFPGDFPDDILDLLHESGDRPQILRDSALVLTDMLETGIYSMPQTGLESLNPDVAELIRPSGARLEMERVPLKSIVTRAGADTALASRIESGSYTSLFERIGSRLLLPFLRENVFYSPADTSNRVTETRAKIEPVMRNIEEGKRVIKKGFIITEEDMADLAALRMTLRKNDLPAAFADLLFIILLFGFLIYFCESRIAGRSLTERESYLVSGLSVLYIAGSVLVRNIPVAFPPAIVVPTALVVMLPAILIHPRLALLLAMALPLGAFVTESFDIASFVFALVSGVAASYSLEGAKKREDIVKVGLFIAFVNLTAMTAVMLWQRYPAGVYLEALFWAALNGLASAMLVLGVLPPLENALNAATAFRLIELSDLNSPILRRLFTSASGTYSHSLMVAQLAEAACQDIEANPLLARVGACYHDIGKMENPEYFVENQKDYNRHDDMAPRLSATVIRSHVKLGVEKARQLGLPQQVIDIIAEHHGNDVIAWFYDKAAKQENADPKKSVVNIEDFTYPGNPPRSRESAVVMLADVAEAAVRALDKPTAVKIEKRIQELIEKKVEHGQLARSELTFRDLETIKDAFVRVLAAYHHSRIEYPKIDASAKNTASDSGNGEAERQ